MSSKLRIQEVNSDSWSDFERLFEAKGSPKYCWCMAWRADPKSPASKTGPGRKSLMKQRVAEGVPVGLLGYLDDEPVAWCSVAPFETFRGLRKGDQDSDGVWSVTCFFVRREHRGQGFTQQMLKAAVVHAKRRGAKRVEAYAVDPSSPSYRHMGFIPLFESAGFTDIGREGSRRHMMQLITARKPRRAAQLSK